VSTPPLAPGSKAPDFQVTTTEGKVVRLADFAGKHLVLYFYPKAFTPGCTKEARLFRDNHTEIEELGGVVLGVSVDDPTVQCDFARENHLTFPLVADADETLSKLYGVTRGFLPFNKRVTFIIDPAGLIAARFQHEVQVGRHVDDVVKFLQRLIAPPA
jgi:thioredoxin-dependent peroxiredoxin